MISTILMLYRCSYNEHEEVVSFLEEHLNVKSDTSEPQSETGEVLVLCPILPIQASGKLILINI